MVLCDVSAFKSFDWKPLTRFQGHIEYAQSPYLSVATGTVKDVLYKATGVDYVGTRAV